MYKKNYPDFYSKNPSFDCIRKLIWIFKQENIGFKYLLNNKQNCYIKKNDFNISREKPWIFS